MSEVEGIDFSLITFAKGIPSKRFQLGAPRQFAKIVEMYTLMGHVLFWRH